MLGFLSYSVILLTLGLGSSGQTSLPFEIHPNGQSNKCVEVRGGILSNGTPVQIYDCNGTPAQKWSMTGSQLQLADSKFCLDAGDNLLQPNGNQLKIWECFPNLPQQRWSIGNDGTIKLTGILYGALGVCLDLPEGRLDNTNVLQTWECSANNANQVWTIQNGPPSSTPAPIPSSTVSTSQQPSPTQISDPVRFRLHPNNHRDKCVEPRDGILENGTPVQIYDCDGIAAQEWVFTLGQVRGLIRVANTKFCLDAGDNTSDPDGNQMKIWECNPTLTQQLWDFTPANNIRLSDVQYGVLGVCLDLKDARLDNMSILETRECFTDLKSQRWIACNTKSGVCSNDKP